MIIYLGCPFPDTSSDQPEGMTKRSTSSLLFGLAPSGVYHATRVSAGPVSSYLTFSPLPAPKGLGGMFSVALSLELLPPGVTRRSAPWCSDFPRTAFAARDHLTCSARPDYKNARPAAQPIRRVRPHRRGTR